MRDQGADPPLDGERLCAVAKPRARFDAGAGFGVSAIVAQPELRARGERRAVAQLECAVALEDEPQARDVAFGGGELVGILTLRPHPHRVGFDVHRDFARPVPSSTWPLLPPA